MIAVTFCHLKSLVYFQKRYILGKRQNRGTGNMRTKDILIKGILISFLLIIPCHIQAIIEIEGTILNDTTWTDQDTIRITNTVTVPDSVQLTIEPGAFIFVDLSKGIEIYGLLIAQGQEDNKIVFTSSADTLGGSPLLSYWRGIYYKQNSNGILQHCSIKYTYYGVSAEYCSIEVRNCTIVDFMYRGFNINGGTLDIPPAIVIDACTIGRNTPPTTATVAGIYVYQSTDIAVSRCRIYNCTYGIDLLSHSDDEPLFQINSCDIRDNTKCGIYMHVCG